MKKYEITEDVVSALIQYLSNRPYAEVAAGIDALRSLPEIPVKEEADETPESAS